MRKSNATRKALREFHTSNDTADRSSSSSATSSYMNFLPHTIVRKYLKKNTTSSKPLAEAITQRLSTTAVYTSPANIAGEYEKKKPTAGRLQDFYDPCNERTIRTSSKTKNQHEQLLWADDEYSLSDVGSMVSVELSPESSCNVANQCLAEVSPPGLGVVHDKENNRDRTHHSSLHKPYLLVRTGKRKLHTPLRTFES